jgi:hypothetical protein
LQSGNVQAVYHYPISPVLMLLVAFLICLVVADMTKIISVHSLENEILLADVALSSTLKL